MHHLPFGSHGRATASRHGPDDPREHSVHIPPSVAVVVVDVTVIVVVVVNVTVVVEVVVVAVVVVLVSVLLVSVVLVSVVDAVIKTSTVALNGLPDASKTDRFIFLPLSNATRSGTNEEEPASSAAWAPYSAPYLILILNSHSQIRFSSSSLSTTTSRPGPEPEPLNKLSSLNWPLPVRGPCRTKSVEIFTNPKDVFACPQTIRRNYPATTLMTCSRPPVSADSQLHEDL